MPETKEIKFKPTIFSEEQKVILNPEFIEFYKSPEDTNPVKFSKLEIDGFRFGIRWVRGYQFYIGRIYCVDIKSTSGQLIKIRLKSLYKINVKQLREKYSTIINTVFNYYFYSSLNQYLRTFNQKQPLSILNVQIKQEGILIIDKNEFIDWGVVEIKSYATYFTILSKSKPEFYKAFDYIYEWNVWVLYNVINQILHSKNLLNN